MNFIKKINFITLTWAIEALNKDSNELKKGQIDFAVGGQAVIEGVMMRSPNSLCIAVRKPNDKIKVKKEKFQTITQRYPKINIPILRGVINLFEMMFVGTKAINYSANETIEEEIEDEIKEASKKGEVSKLMKLFEIIMFIISFVVAISLSLFLFKALPLYITTFLDSKIGLIHENYFIFNIIDGIIKATIFLSYIYILSLIPSFRRVFEYHGSEHKSIFNYEKKLPLTPANADKQSRFHPRCGTSFIIIVFIISILFYTILPKQDGYINNFLLRVTFLPLIAGLSYEALKLSAKYSESAFVKLLIAPGLAFQRLTTKEPNKKQLSVALSSLKAALEMESK